MADVAESAVRVVVSPSLSDGDDRRGVVVDAGTGAVVDDAQGYGYKLPFTVNELMRQW